MCTPFSPEILQAGACSEGVKMIFDMKVAKYLLKNFCMWGKGWVGGRVGGSSVNSVLCSSSLVLLMQTHMTTSCSNFFVHKTFVYEFTFALHIYRALRSWGDAHSADIHSLIYTFHT